MIDVVITAFVACLATIFATSAGLLAGGVVAVLLHRITDRRRRTRRLR